MSAYEFLGLFFIEAAYRSGYSVAYSLKDNWFECEPILEEHENIPLEDFVF